MTKVHAPVSNGHAIATDGLADKKGGAVDAFVEKMTVLVANLAESAEHASAHRRKHGYAPKNHRPWIKRRARLAIEGIIDRDIEALSTELYKRHCEGLLKLGRQLLLGGEQMLVKTERELGILKGAPTSRRPAQRQTYRSEVRQLKRNLAVAKAERKAA